MALKSDDEFYVLGVDVSGTSNAVLAYWDKNQICRSINNAVFNWFKTKPEQMINKVNLRDFLGALYEKNQQHINAAFLGKVQVFEQPMCLPSGQAINSRITYLPDFDEGQVKGIYIHLADISHLNIDDKSTSVSLANKQIDFNDQILEAVTQTLKASILQGFPGIVKLSKKHYISSSKLKRDFKKKYNVTIFSYFRNLQMELAHDYLTQKKGNRNQMALMLNFSNPSNFSSCYKKYLKYREDNNHFEPWENNAYEVYKTLIEQSALAVAMFDINMHFITISPKWLADYNLNGKQFIGKSFKEVLPNVEKKLEEINLYSVKNKDVETVIENSDGSSRLIKSSIRPWYKNLDEIGGVLIFTEDITEMKLMDEKDKQVFEILTKTSEITRIGTWYRDFSTNETNCSRITKEILEVDDDFTVQDTETSLKFYKDGISRTTVEKALSAAVEKGIPFDINVELITAKGNLRKVRVICYTEFDKGMCKKISGIFQDVTNLNLAGNYSQ